MQSAKQGAASAKETAANMAASAKSGMDKTKAVTIEKAERVTAQDPIEKEMATAKRNERMQDAEFKKQVEREHNAAVKHHDQMAAAATGGHMTGGGGAGEMGGGSIGHHQMLGEQTENPVGVVGAHPAVGETGGNNPLFGDSGPAAGNYGTTGGNFGHGTGRRTS